MLERKALSQLAAWATTRRKALLVTGARQVGKSFLVSMFAQDTFSSVVSLDLLEDRATRESLAVATSADDLMLRISIAARTPPCATADRHNHRRGTGVPQHPHVCKVPRTERQLPVHTHRVTFGNQAQQHRFSARGIPHPNPDVPSRFRRVLLGKRPLKRSCRHGTQLPQNRDAPPRFPVHKVIRPLPPLSYGGGACRMR